MRNLFSNLIKIILPLIAGIGVATLADKKLIGKLPAYDEPVSPGFAPKKLLWFLAAFAAGHLLLKFVGRKTRINILK